MNPLLSGHQLDAYLDEAEHAEQRQKEAEVADDLRQSALLALLHRQPCKADTVLAVRRLHRLWLRAGDADAALRVLSDDGAQVTTTLPADELPRARVSLSFWRIEVLQTATAGAALGEAMAHTEQLLTEQGASDTADDAWAHLARLAQRSDDHNAVRRCAAARHKLRVGQADRARYRAWDDSMLALRMAESYAAEPNPEHARLSMRVAINALAGAAPDQDVDHEDWLKLGQSVVAVAPDLMGTVVNGARACVVKLAKPLSPARWRDVEVRLARLEALAYQRQGQLDQALAKAVQGRFSLQHDEDDGFSALVLAWLVQAGRTEQAARLAFECVLNERPGSKFAACELATARMADATDLDFHWPLVLACAASADQTQWVCQGEEPSAFVQRQLALAESRSPRHPAIRLVSALQVMDAHQDYAQALPLLEAAMQWPDLTGSDAIERLWRCRMQVYGVAKALDMPFVDSASAGWCYNVAAHLGQHMRQSLPEGTAWPDARVDQLAARYYERGLAKYEAFFATGQGFFKDGDIHGYSMLCNNLAIHYRQPLEDYDQAIALHHRGIGASPFAEHYSGLRQCYQSAGNDVEFVRAADRLWHFVSDHGFSRHSPCDYVDDAAQALGRLDRYPEISIWLQRLDEWWQTLDEDEQAESEHAYLDSLVITLVTLADSQPEDALARLQPALPRLGEVGVQGLSRVVALVLERAGQCQAAVDWYQSSLTLKQRDGEHDRMQHDEAKKGIKRCQQALRSGRPWWRFGT
ncbi:MAG: hypothetical protein JWP29_1753 [Rhodoferax sp.]|nr:hypothetical protein [Rhodoferax sp.]